MSTAKKVATKRLNKPWHTREKKGKRDPLPWFAMPMFNTLHPLEVLKARIRMWESLDQQFPNTRPQDRDIVEKSLRAIPDDLRWLASRLDALLDEGYQAIAD